MTRIMACGAATDEDIGLLIRAGVDGIGLITEAAQVLECNLSRQQSRYLVSLIPPLVSSILVLTETSLQEICNLFEYIRPDVLQLHGDVTPADLSLLKERLPVKTVKAILVPDQPVPVDHLVNQVQVYLEHGADAILIDRGSGGMYGSTGQPVDKDLARRLKDAAFPRPVILAGGLTAGNVAMAIQEIRPYAVDVFSGIREKGHLSRRKLIEFIRVVRIENREE